MGDDDDEEEADVDEILLLLLISACRRSRRLKEVHVSELRRSCSVDVDC